MFIKFNEHLYNKLCNIPNISLGKWCRLHYV